MTIKKSAVLFVIAVSIFMSYGGCNGNNGSMRMPSNTACDDCPCPFNRIPLTTDCWSREADSNIFGSGSSDGECVLINISEGTTNPRVDLFTGLGGPDLGFFCGVESTRPMVCGFAFQSNLTSFEAEACRICLGQYADALHAFGFPVNNGPPYRCAVPEGE